eukprot:7931636-Alexandrium_andersonii.AAC.1
MLGEELPGMLYEPEHHRVVYQDLPLDPLLQREHQGADQPLELPRRVLDRAIGLCSYAGGDPST